MAAGRSDCSALTYRRSNATADAKDRQPATYYDAAINHLERQTFPRLREELGRVRGDVHVPQSQREKIGQLADNLEKLKGLYAADNRTKGGNDPLSNLRSTHRRLLIELCKSLKLEVPLNVLFSLGDPLESGNNKGSSKDSSTPKK